MYDELQRIRKDFVSLIESVALGREISKITLIKYYRSATGEYLKEAKDIIEALQARSLRGLIKKEEYLFNDNDARIQRLEDSVYYLTQRITTLEQK